jgi:hypothetical protein
VKSTNYEAPHYPIYSRYFIPLKTPSMYVTNEVSRPYKTIGKIIMYLFILILTFLERRQEGKIL